MKKKIKNKVKLNLLKINANVSSKRESNAF